MNPLSLWLITASVALAQTPSKPASQPPRVPEGTRSFLNVSYVEGGHERQKLDLYLPKEGKDLPLIVWIHGGAWRQGSKDGCPALFFLNDGFAVASINYRLSQHATFPAQLSDCKAAIRWLRSHAAEYGLDLQRVGVWGASAGGHLAALIGTSGDVSKAPDGKEVSTKVQAVCDYFGPVDFLRFKTKGELSNVTDPKSSLYQLFGGPLMEHQEMAVLASPLTYITKDDPPFLIVHGDKDELVPLHQSETLHEALTKAGISSTLRVVPGAGHGPFADPTVRDQVREFFIQKLKSR